ncbi:MAG TPA: XRE family transcriptional regulator [Micavibrio sp.]|nr:XRE family transcriptional regulator [Micavibrio sp.]HIL29891.1 XRE family transcriptional regulator [Micavibrio sp.]
MFTIMNNAAMATLETIGRKIAATRSLRGMSQEDLAGVAEVNRGYISRIENGRVAFSIPVLLKIAAALSINPDELLR